MRYVSMTLTVGTKESVGDVLAGFLNQRQDVLEVVVAIVPRSYRQIFLNPPVFAINALEVVVKVESND